LKPFVGFNLHFGSWVHVRGPIVPMGFYPLRKARSHIQDCSAAKKITQVTNVK